MDEEVRLPGENEPQDNNAGGCRDDNDADNLVEQRGFTDSRIFKNIKETDDHQGLEAPKRLMC